MSVHLQLAHDPAVIRPQGAKVPAPGRKATKQLLFSSADFIFVARLSDEGSRALICILAQGGML